MGPESFPPHLEPFTYSLPTIEALITSFTQMPDKTQRGLIGMITNAFLLNKLKYTGQRQKVFKIEKPESNQTKQA